MTTTFDEQWNPDDDPYAVILSPAAPERAYERREPTLDDLLDLRIRMTTASDSLADMAVDMVRGTERSRMEGKRQGVEIALNYLDELLRSL